MHTSSLRKVGGSVMMAVPPALLEQLNLRAGMVVGLDTDGERLVVLPQRKPRYTLEALLAEWQDAAPVMAEDRAWLDVTPVGREI
jgi:antitoxin ChpS